MLKWKSSWNKSCRSQKTEQSWYSKVFFIWPPKQYENHNGHHFPVEITEISVEIHRNFIFWILILFSFGISEIRRNFGRNFVSGSWRDSVEKRKGEPCLWAVDRDRCIGTWKDSMTAVSAPRDGRSCHKCNFFLKNTNVILKYCSIDCKLLGRSWNPFTYSVPT